MIAQVSTKSSSAVNGGEGNAVLRLVLKMAGVGAALAGTALLGLCAAVGYRSARPGRSFGTGDPDEGTYERVLFASADGLQLSGWFFPSGKPGPGIVLCHGFQTGRREALPVALGLRERGYNTLVFDFRAHGESEGRWTSCGFLETRDLEGAVRYLQGRPEVVGHRVGVVGFSMGAAVSILTAARMPEIAAVVADSPFATLRGVLASGFRVIFRLPAFPLANVSLWFAEKLVGVCADEIRPVDYVALVSPRPLLIIHGEADQLIPVANAHAVYATAAEPKEIWTVPGADHVEARLQDPEGYLDRVESFLSRALRDEHVRPRITQIQRAG